MAKILEILTLDEVKALPVDHVKPPANVTGNCIKCGKCCKFYQCPLWDDVGKVCMIYPHRPVACRMWPHRQSDIVLIGCPGYKQTGL